MAKKFNELSNHGLDNKAFGLINNPFYEEFELTNQVQIAEFTSMAARGGKSKNTSNDTTNDNTETVILETPKSLITGTDLNEDGSILDDYNIQINFTESDWISNSNSNSNNETIDLSSAFIDAANTISSWIENTDIVPDGDGIDLTLDVSLVNIDGTGGVLGQAGPTTAWTEDGNNITFVSEGIMEFDVADATDYYNQGLWDYIVLHEMIHTLGFGTLWGDNYFGLTSIDDNGTRTPKDDIAVYTGVAANAYYGDQIVVESDGGSGTAYGHWDEELYNNELMTGYIDESMYISQETIASLIDLGYDISDATISDYDHIEIA